MYYHYHKIYYNFFKGEDILAEDFKKLVVSDNGSKNFLCKIDKMD